MTQEVAVTMNQIDHTAQVQYELSEKLNKMVEKFKI